MSTRETKVAAIPDVRDDNVTEVLRAVKNVLQVREGLLGDTLDQYVTWRDLTDVSVVSAGGTSTLTNGTRVPVIVPPTVDTGYDPTADLTTPSQPTGLTITSGMTSIYLAWTGASYQNHAYTEIWRASTDSIGSAVRIGTTITNLYSDPVGKTNQTYYYWIRFVSAANVSGPYNATAGTVASTGLVGGVDLSPLIITADKIASGAIDLGGSKITGLLANANMAVITDPTKIADSLIGNTKLANLAVDAAKLADSSVTATKIANLAVGTAAIQTGAITTALIANAAIGSAQIADAAITSAKIGNLAVGNAAIQNGAITNAKISDLTADKITAGNLTAAINVNTGYIYGGVNPAGSAPGTSSFGTGYLLGAYGGANQFFIGSPDQNLLWNGTNLSVKGTINALAGYIGQNIIDANGISSPNYVSGSAGWSVNKDGGAEFNNVTVRGCVIAGNNPSIDSTNNTIMTSGTSGVRLYSDGRVVMGNGSTSVVWNNSGLYINGLTNATTSGYSYYIQLLGSQTVEILAFTVSRGGPIMWGSTWTMNANYDGIPASDNRLIDCYFIFELYKDGVSTGSIWNQYMNVHGTYQWGTTWSMSALQTLAPGTYRLKVNTTYSYFRGRWWYGNGTLWKNAVMANGDYFYMSGTQSFAYQATV